MEYCFNLFNKLAADGTAMAVERFLREPPAAQKGGRTKNFSGGASDGQGDNGFPVVLCVGSDLAIGDSLGPIVGSMLKYKTQGLNCFLYGTLAAPVTAKEIRYMRTFLRETHRGRKVIAVDAAVGDEGDIGLIKVNDRALMPGAGANKKLGSIGDVSIMGIVAEKSLLSYGLLNSTRLNLVYSMAEIISDGLSALLWEMQGRGARKIV